MSSIRMRLLVILSALALGTPAAGQETLLQNDGFVDGQSVGFQGGFAAGEMAGSRLVPAGTGPWRVNRVRFLFGGATSTHTITLRIYDDAAGTSAPGPELFSADYQVTGSNTVMQEIVLTGDNVLVAGQFRVAIQFQHSGLPSIARDGDGTIEATRNFIFSPSIPGWFQSNLFGLTGDWIIRAGVEPVSGGGGTAPEILSVLDVGNDQGRQVRVRFQRSDQDEAGAGTPIVQYELFRRIDALAKASQSPAPGITLLDGWDYVGSVPAHGETVYNAIVPTLADSTIADGMSWSVFLVRAATALPLTFFDSEPDSGYSLDNLSPAPPQGLAYGGGLLSWSPAPEADFDYYTVYGSNTGSFGPAAVLLERTSAEEFTVPGSTYRYYFVTASDFSGNEGGPAAIDLGTASDAGLPLPGLVLRAVPNPFNPTTTLTFELPAPARVVLSVYRADGRLVRRVRDEYLPAGPHRAVWDGTDAAGVRVASGAYVARLEVGGRQQTFALRLVR